jgi:rubredoxin
MNNRTDTNTTTTAAMQVYLCVVCGFVYDEATGRPEDGIKPGTRWADVPEDWRCPECNVGKADFDMIAL